MITTKTRRPLTKYNDYQLMKLWDCLKKTDNVNVFRLTAVKDELQKREII